MAHTEYGKFLIQADRRPEAEVELRKGVEVEPANRASRFVLASFYLVTKQLDKAEAAYKALADLDKDKPEGSAVLADFYSAVNRPDEAIRIYRELLVQAPDFSQGRYRLSEIMLNNGDAKGAMAQVDELLKRISTIDRLYCCGLACALQAGQTSDLKQRSRI